MVPSPLRASAPERSLEVHATSAKSGEWYQAKNQSSRSAGSIFEGELVVESGAIDDYTDVAQGAIPIRSGQLFSVYA